VRQLKIGCYVHSPVSTTEPPSPGEWAPPARYRLLLLTAPQSIPQGLKSSFKHSCSSILTEDCSPIEHTTYRPTDRAVPTSLPLLLGCAQGRCSISCIPATAVRRLQLGTLQSERSRLSVDRGSLPHEQLLHSRLAGPSASPPPGPKVLEAKRCDDCKSFQICVAGKDTVGMLRRAPDGMEQVPR
jgi:hypothetical protein